MAALSATQAKLSENQFIQLKLIGQIREAARKSLNPYRKTGLIYSELSWPPMEGRCSRGLPEEDAYQKEPFCGAPESL